MSTELTMTTWTVVYNDHGSPPGYRSTPRSIDIDAAYYVPAAGGYLVEFKDVDHQVVFAVHSGIVTTIRRVDAVKRDEAIA